VYCEEPASPDRVFSLSIPLTKIVFLVEEQQHRKPAGWPKDMGANSRKTLSDTLMFSSKKKRSLKKKPFGQNPIFFFFLKNSNDTFSNSRS